MTNQFEEPLRKLFEQAQTQYQKLRSTGADQENLVENDIVTAVDQAMTDLINNFFDDFDDETTFALVSEEMNKSESNREVEDADYTVLFDEVDGTAKMRRRTGSFGPIVAVAEGENPQFRDVVAAGFLNLAENEFYEAIRDEGAFRIDGFGSEDQTRTRIETSQRSSIEGEYLMGLLLDQPMLGKVPEIASEAWQYPCNDFGVQARHYSWVADGTWDAFITGGHSYMPEKEVNTGEELAGLHRIVREAGGEVVDWNGEPIAEQRIGLLDSVNHDIVAAASSELAVEVAEEIVQATVDG